jgi:hypothetical protein
VNREKWERQPTRQIKPPRQRKAKTMFYHMHRAAETSHTWQGRTYEIRVFRAREDGHLRVYVSTDALSDLVIVESVERNPAETPKDEVTAINAAIERAKRAIEAGTLTLE